MAVVFVSSKEKQKVFFRTVIISVAVVLLTAMWILIALLFWGKGKIAPIEPSLLPSVGINLDVINSDQIKNLKPFYNLLVQFAYTVEDKDGKKIEGNISANTKEEAQALLLASEFKVISLTQMGLGRTNPFTPY